MSAATVLAVLSAGAAKGIVDALAPAFEHATGSAIAGTFGAVGTIRERLLGGAACDALILTATMLDELVGEGWVLSDTRAVLGEVPTGIAVRRGDPHPPVADPEALRTSLARAPAWYCPDTGRATAGIHFLRVLRELGLAGEAADRLRAFPSGAVAMQALAQSASAGAIGCTQVTEILYTPGVDLVGVLPAAHALATPYAVGVSVRAREPDLARRFARLLASPDTLDLRSRGGFIAMARG